MRLNRRRRKSTISRSAKPRKRAWWQRARTLESLESRELLAGDLPSAAPWQNPIYARDVNFDMRVTPNDALLVINYLISSGSTTLTTPQATPLTSSGKPKYLDVSGDNRVTAHDVLLVINALAANQLMMVETFPTNMAGDRISDINVGESFKLVTQVKDIRTLEEPSTGGVFSAAVDVAYTASRSSVTPANNLTFATDFSLDRETNFTVPGHIYSNAARSSLDPPGQATQDYWSVTMTATAAGPQMFMPSFESGVLITSENSVYGDDEIITNPDDIMYVGSQLNIIATVPTISIADVSQSESSGIFLFTVTLSGEAEGDVTVNFSTADDTAIAADPFDDYEPTSGQLTFEAGTTMLTIPVTVNDDDVAESNERFFVNLTGSSANATIIDNVAEGIIENDDSPPTLVVSDASAAAGPQETQMFFTVSLTAEITETVFVGYATENGTGNNAAIAGTHYDAASGVLQFNPGDPLFQVVPVTVKATVTPDIDRMFFMRLSSGSITIEDDLGVGTIVTQGITISDASVLEGGAGTTTNAVFTVRLAQSSESPVTVTYQTLTTGTATPGQDYVAVPPTQLTFDPGTTERTIVVVVNGDDDPEPNETFTVSLSNAQGVPVFVSQGVGTIRNDDGNRVGITLEATDLNGVPLPQNSALDVGDTFYLQVSVQDLLSQDPTGVFQAFLDVSYPTQLVAPDVNSLEWNPFYSTLRMGTFEDGLLNDFGASGQLPPLPASFDPAAEQLLFRVMFTTLDVGLINFTGSVDEDDLDEGHETLVYTVDEALNSEEINVQNRSVNVGENVIVAANTSAPESGSIVFAVTRFLPSNQPAVVQYSTVDGTAIAGLDYVAPVGSPTLSFAAGEVGPKFVTISLINDTIDEDDETFELMLTSLDGNATVSAARPVATIIDDDLPPTVNVVSGSGLEGQNVVFTVRLSAPSGRTVTVDYETADAVAGNLATAGEDYVPRSGAVTFAPNQTERFVTVQALGDLLDEENEVFRLLLSNPDNATLGVASGTGTIIDVPPGGIFGYVYSDLNNNGMKEPTETGIAGVIVTAIPANGGTPTQTTTDETGAYSFPTLFPGQYSIVETQPGFFNDGRDTRLGVESPANDRFLFSLESDQRAEGFNFGERGVRTEFISAFINRRALFSTASVGGISPQLNLSATTLNLNTGEIWVSFDGGWEGLRLLEATNLAGYGTMTMRLYNNALQQVAASGITSNNTVALYYNGHSGSPYFLRLSGTSPSVAVNMSTPELPSAIPTADDGGDDEATTPDAEPLTSGSLVSGRFASEVPAAVPMTAPQSESLASSASDEALAEDEDWLLDTLLA